MAVIRPFRALRPAPEVASRVASVPYDVVSRDEAQALSRDEPLSFLHVSRAEVDLSASTNPYAEEVYEKATDNFRVLTHDAPFVRDAEPSFYVYRLTAGGHSQTGVAAAYSLDEYERGKIKRHEYTRPDKEDDRTRHMLALGAQTGLVFLTYRAMPAIDAVARRACANAPEIDFEASDGVRHTIWRVPTAENGPLTAAFETVPALYIADGHHRAASAARVRAELTARAVPVAGRRGGACRYRAGGGVSGHRRAHPAVQPGRQRSRRTIAGGAARCHRRTFHGGRRYAGAVACRRGVDVS